MKLMNLTESRFRITIVLIAIFTAVAILVLPAFSHGPKGHGGMTFTPLQAAKKGIMLYDKLVANGKLPNSWEIELNEIKVIPRNNNNKEEFVVQFNRTNGDPRSVYIFFDEKGEYSGSNFTGK
jgi:hypothetical protein